MVKSVSEVSTDMESIGDIVKYINQQKDEIIQAIKEELTEDTLGKLRSFLFLIIIITNNCMYLVPGS